MPMTTLIFLQSCLLLQKNVFQYMNTGRQVVGQVKKVGKSRNFHQKVGIFPPKSRKK